MARTLITPTPAPLLSVGRTFFPTLQPTAGTLTLTMTAADVSNSNYAPITDGRTYLIVQNSDTSAHTVTISSVADAQNRTGDITAYSVAAAGVCFIGPFTNLGWNQPASPGPVGLYFSSNSALVLINVMTVPA
jgi:hypothetical protein